MTRPGFTHGTRYGYEQKGCKCDQCMGWSRGYRAQLRQRRKAREATPAGARRT